MQDFGGRTNKESLGFVLAGGSSPYPAPHLFKAGGQMYYSYILTYLTYLKHNVLTLQNNICDLMFAQAITKVKTAV